MFQRWANPYGLWPDVRFHGSKPALPEYELYTDGACDPNPGPGGWGFLLARNGKEYTQYGGKYHTTNQQMELIAAIQGLRYFRQRSNVTLYTDSMYLVKGMTEWIHTWVRNGWKNHRKKTISNLEQWKELYKLVGDHNVTFTWVKGHSGNRGNEIADGLARKGLRDTLRGKYD